MSALLRTSFLFFILTLVASAASEENINQQKDAAPGGKLVVDVDFGTINVVTGADDKVVIEAYRKIDFGDEAKEKEYFAAAPVAISQDGNIVTVRARCKRSPNNSGVLVTRKWTVVIRFAYRRDLRPIFTLRAAMLPPEKSQEIRP